jgi:hypothetical protein
MKSAHRHLLNIIFIFSSSISKKIDAYINTQTFGWITAVGEGGVVWKSSDGGVSWRSQQSGTRFDLYDVYYKNARSGFIVGSNATFIQTVNAGLEWTVTDLGIPSIAKASFFGIHSFSPPSWPQSRTQSRQQIY